MKRDSHLGIYALRRNITHLKHFAKFLVVNEYLSKNPLQQVKLPVGKTKEKRALTEQEVEMLLRALECHAPSIYPAMFFIANTGLRKNEALTLEWENIDWKNRMVRLRNKPHLIVNGEPFYCKWGSERSVPLKESVLEQLLTHDRSSRWVFPNRDGEMITNNVNRNFNRARKKSGIERPEEISPHSLRHTWISQLLANGVDLKSVSVMAGHKNLATTQLYAHLVGGVEKMHLDIAKLPDFGKKVPAARKLRSALNKKGP